MNNYKDWLGGCVTALINVLGFLVMWAGICYAGAWAIHWTGNLILNNWDRIAGVFRWIASMMP